MYGIAERLTRDGTPEAFAANSYCHLATYDDHGEQWVASHER